MRFSNNPESADVLGISEYVKNQGFFDSKLQGAGNPGNGLVLDPAIERYVPVVNARTA